MKTFNTYVNEWKLTNDSKIEIKKIKPESYEELRELIINRYIENDKILDLRDIDVSDITTFGNYYGKKHSDGIMYEGWGLFYELNNVEIIDVTGWNTENIKNMEYMFDQLKNLKEIRGIKNWNISNVLTSENMFRQCESLRTLDLSRWKPQKLRSMDSMFDGCENLTEIKGIEKWDTFTIEKKYCAFRECDAAPSWYDRNKWE